MDAATWQAQIALNLDAAFYTMQAVLPYMVAATGSIINISSIAASVISVNRKLAMRRPRPG